MLHLALGTPCPVKGTKPPRGGGGRTLWWEVQVGYEGWQRLISAVGFAVPAGL